MALDFPNSPSIGDEFTGGGFTWVWSGFTWEKVTAAAEFPIWFPVNSQTHILTKTFAPGLYKFTAIKTSQDSTPTATATFKNSSGATILEVSLLDLDTSNTLNNAERFIQLTSTAESLYVGSSLNIYFSVDLITSQIANTSTIQVTSYTSNQTVTVPSDVMSVLILGGGGGGATYDSWSGGGGSGYLTTSTSITPGSYALVIGSGGSPDSSGGTTTFAGLTAAGGGGGYSQNGAAGGSGGAGGTGTGGTNGSNGGGWSPGAGSGIQLPSWVTIPSVPNGFYGGGNGGNGSGHSGTSAGANTGGGGNGASGGGASGGNGGSGVLLIARMVS